MRLVTILATAVLSLGLLAGCTATPAPAPSDTPTATPTPSSEAKPTPTPTSTPTTPVAEDQAAPIDAGPNDIYPNKPAATDLSCNDAVVAAAAVPGDLSNNDEVYVSLIACGSVAEWGSAIVANPGVFAVTSVAQSEIEFYTMIVCSGAEETPVCIDAAAQGMI